MIQTKKQLAIIYRITPAQRSLYMNVVFYDELVKVGYYKEMRLLTPAVVIRFTELYGPSPEKQ